MTTNSLCPVCNTILSFGVEELRSSSTTGWFRASPLVIGHWVTCSVCNKTGPVRASKEDALFVFTNSVIKD